MKTLILYYSYSGHTKALAKMQALSESADLAEIKDISPVGIVKAYTAGCIAALRGKAWPIQALDADLNAYDRLALLSPVWAGNPPPAVNAALELLPEGKALTVKMVSASGRSKCRQRLEDAIKEKGCALEGFEDIQA